MAAPNPLQEIAAEVQAILDPSAPAPSVLPRPLTREEVKEVLVREIEGAVGYLHGSEIAGRRKTARDYYLGKKFGNEVEGFSEVVSQDVLKCVEWVKPALMRIFTSSETMGRYLPRYRAGEPFEICEARAEQASDFVARRFEAGGGFMVLLTLISDALLENLGIGKVVADRHVSRERKTFMGLSEMELVRLLQEPGTIPVEYEQRVEDVGLRDPMTGEPVPVVLHDVTVMRMSAEPELRWLNVAPEHFLHSRGATALDDRVVFVGDRSRMTKSECVAMGYPAALVYAVASIDTPDFHQAHQERYSDEGGFHDRDRFRPDVAAEEIWVTDAYLLIDEDGDGYAERRRIVAAGTGPNLVILDDKEVSVHPYFGFSPIPLPHKIDGLGIADIMADLQKLRSTVLRGIADFIFQTLSPFTEIVEGNVNIDDILTRRAGGYARVREQGSITPLPPQPLPSGVFELLAGLDQEVKARTGVQQASEMLDPAAGKNQTLGGVYELLNTAAIRVDLIARIAAEVAIKPMFAKALRLLHEYPPKRQIVRLRGAYVEIDPSEWDPEMEVEIDVVLGAGQSGQRVDALRSVVEWQMRLREMGHVHMVSDKQFYNGLTDLVREAGFKYPQKYFSDPDTTPPPPPPPPDPDLIEAVSRAQKHGADIARDKAELIVDARQKEIELQIQALQAEAQMIQAQASLMAARQPRSQKKEK